MLVPLSGLLLLALSSDLTSAKVTCRPPSDSQLIRREVIALSRPGLAPGWDDQDGYFRTLAVRAESLQTIQDNYTTTPYDTFDDYDGVGLRVSFYSCSSSFNAGSRFPYYIGKLAVEPTKSAGQISPKDKCITFHAKHKHFGIAKCSFVDDESQGLQAFASNDAYRYRFVGPPTKLTTSFNFTGPGWELTPSPNKENREWTVQAKFKQRLKNVNGFVGNFKLSEGTDLNELEADVHRGAARFYRLIM